MTVSAFWLAMLLCVGSDPEPVCAWRVWAEPLPDHLGCALAFTALREVYEPKAFRCLPNRPDLPEITRAAHERWARANAAAAARG